MKEERGVICIPTEGGEVSLRSWRSREDKLNLGGKSDRRRKIIRTDCKKCYEDKHTDNYL